MQSRTPTRVSFQSHIPHSMFTSWHLALGANLILYAAAVAFVALYAASYAGTVAAAVFIMTAGLQALNLSFPRHASARPWLTVSALLFLSMGAVLVFAEPAMSETTGIILLAAFTVDGAARTAAALSSRRTPGWKPAVYGGFATIAFGTSTIFWLSPVTGPQEIALSIAAFLSIVGAAHLATWLYIGVAR